MTGLRKKVTRVTVSPDPWTRRLIAVTLEPGDVLSFREKGRRRIYSAPIAKVFAAVVKWNVAAEAAERRKEKAICKRS